MLSRTCEIVLPPSPATLALSVAGRDTVRVASAACSTVVEICSIADADSSRLAAACSLRWLRSVDALEISSLASKKVPAAAVAASRGISLASPGVAASARAIASFIASTACCPSCQTSCNRARSLGFVPLAATAAASPRLRDTPSMASDTCEVDAIIR